MVTRSYQWLVVVLALAFLLMAAQPAVAADEVQGKIKSMAAAPDYKLVVTDNSGKEWTFPLDDGTKVKINGAQGQLADLKPGDEVSVTHSGAEGLFLATEIRAQRK